MTGIASRTRSRRAYTLIELVIVIALLGTAASLLIPHMVGRSTMETQAAVRLLIADLSFAQSDAMAHQELRRVHFYDDGRGYCIVRVLGSFDAPFDPDDDAQYINDPIAPAGHLGRYIVDFGADDRFAGLSVSAINIDGGRRYITYDSLGGTVASGGLPGTGGSITLTSNEANYRINIAPFTGKLTVEKVE